MQQLVRSLRRILRAKGALGEAAVLRSEARRRPRSVAASLYVAALALTVLIGACAEEDGVETTGSKAGSAESKSEAASPRSREAGHATGELHGGHQPPEGGHRGADQRGGVSHGGPTLETIPRSDARQRAAFPPAPPVREQGLEPSFRTRAAVRRALARERRIKRIRRLPPTRDCQSSVPPPVDIVSASRVVGNRVTVRFRFARLPRSPRCRPHLLEIWVGSGKLDSPSFRFVATQFRVVRKCGSGTVRVPGPEQTPYLVSLQPVTLDGTTRSPVAGTMK